MAKVTTTDPAEAERKLAVLRPQLEELELKVQQAKDPKQKKKLIKKIEKTEDKMAGQDRRAVQPSDQEGFCGLFLHSA